jgi:ABC-type multidrug transport system ATPase subunit
LDGSTQRAAGEPVVELDRVFQHVGIHCALQRVSLRLQRGEMLLLIGPNGAGKTLLTRLIVGLDPPSAGTVRVFGRDLAGLDDRGMSGLRRRVGAVLQRGSLLDGLSVLENLLLPLRQTPGGRAEMARAARLVMTQLQLDGMENYRPRSLSVGQQRRVELARALIHRPDLLIWDGLTDGLDRPAVSDLVGVLQTERQTRGLSIIATDNSMLEAFGEQSRVAVLDHGRLLFDGSGSELDEALSERLELRYVIEGHA